MSSQVDATIPADGVKASKATFRANFLTIKNEITALQRQTRLPWKIAFGELNV